MKQIYFEGFKTDVPKYLKKASILCLTSNTEGLPMVLLEAMKYGVIPFSYDSFASVYDIIDDCENGFIIPAFDEMDYVEKLKLLMQNQDLQNRMAINAFEKSKEFRLEVIIEKWGNLISEIV